VAAFVTALGRSTVWARGHQSQAIAIMRTQSARDYKGQIARSVPATLKLLRTSRLDPAAWTAFGNWMWRHGLLKSQPDGASLVTQP
jgi:ABC-type nitrate/sulfonate/bicarbonate transport system substrate-binding protein